MRGAVDGSKLSETLIGIIPARAGSSDEHSGHWGLLPDHPRACGEQRATNDEDARAEGSSPRVRGAGNLRAIAEVESRIIPARAGSRPTPLRHWPTCEDHPRACGEQLFRSPLFRSPLGSSPRVRGAAMRYEVGGEYERIIPARAGSSWAVSRICSRSQDHPRACGEQVLCTEEPECLIGSSPRVRGAETSQARGH